MSPKSAILDYVPCLHKASMIIGAKKTLLVVNWSIRMLILIY